MVTKRQITNDWKQLFPELKKTRLLEMDNRLGPLITGIYLKVIRNTYYTPVFYVHNLCREYSSITTSLECTSETIELEKHEERYMFSAERLKNKLLIPLKGDVPIDKIIEPSDVFQTLQQSSAEVSKEKIVQGMKETDPGVFASVLTESVQKSIDKNSYGAPVTVTVKVEKNHSGTYELSETERSKLETAMFPTTE